MNRMTASSSSRQHSSHVRSRAKEETAASSTALASEAAYAAAPARCAAAAAIRRASEATVRRASSPDAPTPLFLFFPEEPGCAGARTLIRPTTRSTGEEAEAAGAAEMTAEGEAVDGEAVDGEAAEAGRRAERKVARFEAMTATRRRRAVRRAAAAETARASDTALSWAITCSFATMTAFSVSDRRR